MQRKLRVLPREISPVLRKELGAERSALNTVEQSADGIGGVRQVKLMRHGKAERRSNREVEPQSQTPKARTVPPKGMKREEKSVVEEER
jgi:hypothetical protein